MAIKPWVGAIKAPTSFSNQEKDANKAALCKIAMGDFARAHRSLVDAPGERSEELYADVAGRADVVMDRMAEAGVSDAAAPENDDLELAWVQGYTGATAYNNIHYLPSGTKATPRRTLNGASIP